MSEQKSKCDGGRGWDGLGRRRGGKREERIPILAVEERKVGGQFLMTWRDKKERMKKEDPLRGRRQSACLARRNGMCT